jgi:hypothetical protein
MWGTNIFQHLNEHVHSSLTAGPERQGQRQPEGAKYKSGYYGSVNVFWDVVKNFTFGAEVVAGERININDDKGSALRLQMNATYKFNKTFK